MKKSVFIFIFILVALIMFTSGVFSETLYYKEYKYGTICLEWDGTTYTLTTKEINSDGFIDVCVVKFTDDIYYPEEVLYVTEKYSDEGRYKKHFDECCKTNDIKLVNTKTYFKDKNLCYEYDYEAVE